ncbi:ABC transporter permease [Hyphococcus sp.]|uniref:ABC transporter permease n=1 Tax=Hyphococcus sp. TaxID=2038636 RepID=UPI002084C395|nr:MAG: putative O-antigen/lipopolysaccharide transport integral membrane protein ABC transporter RfbD [Marinicaulis sp.]
MSTNVYDYQAGLSNWSRALEDLKTGWSRRQLWTDMAVRGFNGRYRGAGFGAFWLTLTTAMTAAGLGVLYGYLFGRPLAEHLPYVTCAIISWGLITGLANGGCQVFVGNSHTFKEFPLPASLFAYRLVLTEFITTAYKALVLLAVVVIFSVPLNPAALFALIGLALIIWTGFWSSLFLGVINARYRDFGQLVSAFFTFAFFLTPIFWLPERLGKYAYLVNLNPFYHLIEVIRGPILGHPDLWLHFAVAGAFALVTPILGLLVYGRLSNRLPYWC